MIQPYEIGHFECSNDCMQLYITEDKQIILMSADDQDDMYVYDAKNNFKKLCSTMDYKYFGAIPQCVMKGIRPATRKELKAIGLWDMVVNKEDFSSTEDELEYYLELAEKDDNSTA